MSQYRSITCIFTSSPCSTIMHTRVLEYYDNTYYNSTRVREIKNSTSICRPRAGYQYPAYQCHHDECTPAGLVKSSRPRKRDPKKFAARSCQSGTGSSPARRQHSLRGQDPSAEGARPGGRRRGAIASLGKAPSLQWATATPTSIATPGPWATAAPPHVPRARREAKTRPKQLRLRR